MFTFNQYVCVFSFIYIESVTIMSLGALLEPRVWPSNIRKICLLPEGNPEQPWAHMCSVLQNCNSPYISERFVPAGRESMLLRMCTQQHNTPTEHRVELLHSDLSESSEAQKQWPPLAEGGHMWETGHCCLESAERTDPPSPAQTVFTHTHSLF